MSVWTVQCDGRMAVAEMHGLRLEAEFADGVSSWALYAVGDAPGEDVLLADRADCGGSSLADAQFAAAVGAERWCERVHGRMWGARLAAVEARRSQAG